MAESVNRLHIYEETSLRRVRSHTDVGVPRYGLYGDVASSRAWFVNLEPLDQRASALDWTIQPHTHPKFTQLVFVADGSGEMTLDGDVIPFAGPCVLVVPPFRIHGFRYSQHTAGTVVTIENNFLGDLLARAQDLRVVLETAGAFALSDDAHQAVAIHLADLRDELGGGRRGGRIGAEIQLLHIVLIVLRDRRFVQLTVPSPRAELVDRFLELVEARYREQPDLAEFCSTLGVTTAQLRTACRETTGLSPLAMLHDRVAAESKRCLIYTTMSVSEIGYSLGFHDAAYFTRFFTRTTGISPSRFRQG